MPFNFPGTDTTFIENVRCKSVTDNVLGGLNGPANVGLQDLADRTQFLNSQDFAYLQSQIEKISGGNITIRMDDHGHIDYFFVLEKFKPSEIDSDMGDYTNITGWSTREYHPSFYVNGVLKDRILVSIFTGTVDITTTPDTFRQPGANENPMTSEYTISELRTYITNKGTGYHLMNFLEYSAIALKSLEKMQKVYGNDAEGKSSGTAANAGLSGRNQFLPIDGLCYVGSGPDEWNHNGQTFGISDIVGNVQQALDGIYISAGQIYTYSTRDNNYTEVEGSYTATSIFYKVDGGPSLVLDTSAGGSLPHSEEFTDMDLTTALKAAGNELVDSTYIVDTLLCSRWWNGSSEVTPGLWNTNSLTLGEQYIAAGGLTNKIYLEAGGNFEGVAPTGRGLAGLGTRFFQDDSSILHGRYCLIE